MNLDLVYIFIYFSCALGVIWSWINYRRIASIQVYHTGTIQTDFEADEKGHASLTEIGGYIA
jgi:hypothetical protein